MAINPGPVARVLSGWVAGVARHPWLVLLTTVLACVAAGNYTARTLGINTATTDMIAPTLAWRLDFIRFREAFPQFSNTLLIVLDGADADTLDRAAQQISTEIEAQPDLAGSIFDPVGDPFFLRNGLLYQDLGAIDDLADRLALMQPFLGRLAGDPSLPAFLDLLATAIRSDSAAAREADAFLAPLSAVLEQHAAGARQALSWQRLGAGIGSTANAATRVLILQPPLDFARLLPAREIVERLRASASRLQQTPATAVRMRLTGPVALEYEELRSVSRGAARSGILAALSVALVLWLALRGWRGALACLGTLIAGLILTAAFAAAAIGHLNLISIAFAVLYIGLGIDFAIHLTLRYQELLQQGGNAALALTRAAGDVGAALWFCALTTSIGFFAFFPTTFAGVAELGLISGVGMYISLLCSVTILPALLTLLAVPAAPAPRLSASAWHGWPARHRRMLMTTALILAVAAAAAMPSVRFDPNPLNLRETGSESVQTWRDLLASSDTPGLTMSVLVADQQQATDLAAQLAGLPTVAAASSLVDLLPAQQAEKLERIADLRLLLGPLPDPADRTATTPQRASLASFAAALASSETAHTSPRTAALQSTRFFLSYLDALPAAAQSAALQALQDDLLGGFPAQLRRLQFSLRASSVDEASLPARLLARWRSGDGLWRVEITPSGNLADNANLREFVSSVRAIAPAATGLPVVQIEAGDAVVGAFRQAFLSALAVVTVLLLLILRNLRDTALVLLPVLLAGLLTAGLSVAVNLPFNFANVIALPLLLGVGVDNGIHMIHRRRHATADTTGLLGTSTSRAVWFSALTTVASFGNLALSAHPGTASMGLLLAVGMALIVLCTLVLLPALIEGEAV